MAEPPEHGSSIRLEFEFPTGRISTFAKVAYQQDPGADADGVRAVGIGVTFDRDSKVRVIGEHLADLFERRCRLGSNAIAVDVK